ncbi:GNAT family N-acetyltransferase [Streptomyces monticola]|uniref:GNAT family N-acetyltransferase n=1 Tax=Streptomyces monticola TaxID=2666263 RepID=A0ABW2JDT5_9ACTN
MSGGHPGGAPGSGTGTGPGVGAGDGSSLTLRPARPADVGDIARIWYAGWQDGHLGHVPDVLTEARTEESFTTRAAQGVGDTVVAVVDGAVAGFTMVVGDEVEQLYVDARHRGTNAAAALLTEAERLVRAAGHRRAWLAVVAGNGRARRFYDRQGWLDEGPFEHRAPSATGPINVSAHRYVKDVQDVRDVRDVGDVRGATDVTGGGA